MANKTIEVAPLAFLIRLDSGVKALVLSDSADSRSLKLVDEVAAANGWKPLYDHVDDGQTEALRVANCEIKDLQDRYRKLERAALDGDRMIDNLRDAVERILLLCQYFPEESSSVREMIDIAQNAINPTAEKE